ncbi:urea transporter [Pseudomonas indica]|uniref:urea transporter n=1 Tax=Pseudomonas indica TaxID=137658 RepID=UPI000BABB0BB|nr:urea transporter [Pseudomonas indica]PAU61538.1 urea transporter [Pseudomonas indica]
MSPHTSPLSHLPSLSKPLLNGFAQIFLQAHPGCGLLCLLAIALWASDLLGGALLGGLAGTLVAWRRGYDRDDIDTGLYGYNGILLGLLASLSFAWSLLLPLLIVCAAGLSSLAVHHLLRAMRERQWLPAFTSPFVLLGWLLLALAGPLELEARETLPAAPLSLDWPNGLGAFARGLGQVVFLDHPLAGLCLFAGLLLADRRAALWAALGSALGLALALLQGWPAQNALLGLHGYNAALAAIALGQTHRAPWAPAIGLLLALLLQPGFAALGLPALTMPFILACWLVYAGQRVFRQGAATWHPGRH